MDVAISEADRWADLRGRWASLKGAEPRVRARDAAARLGVSEGELLAARCGEGVQHLDTRWKALIDALPSLGPVMVLTRNEHAVHEKVGQFENVTVSGKMGLVLGEAIDLRILLGHWSFAFAVAEGEPGKARRSLQVFDRHGTAVHKIYLRAESDAAAFDGLVAAHLAADQSPGISVAPRVPPAPDRPDSAIDCATLRERWLALKDVHDFRDLLNDLEVSRLQALRLVGRDLAWPVAVGSFRTALEAAAADAVPIMVFVGSPGVIQIHSGPVQNLKEVGPWFNVLDPGFNLHLWQDGVASAWIVRKPTADGIVTSLEIYDAARRQIATMFGVRKAGEAERAEWRALVETLGREER